MTLLNVLLLALVVYIGLQFWRIRAISEFAQHYLDQYCNKHGLQLIAVARQKTRLTTVQGKPDWHCHFAFDFSASGDDAYQGTLEMKGKHVIQTSLPVHRDTF